MVHPSNPAKDLKEFIASHSGKPIEYASAGVGSGSYIAAEYLFKVLAKTQTLHVPFPGGAPAITAVLGNHVGAIAATVSPMIVTSTAASCAASASPAPARRDGARCADLYRERLHRVHRGSWVGFFVPAKTGAGIVDKLNAAINEALKEPAVVERLKRFGLDPMIADTPGRRFFNGEVDRWGKMVKAIGVSID